MPGILFIVCVPEAKYERSLLKDHENEAASHERVINEIRSLKTSEKNIPDENTYSSTEKNSDKNKGYVNVTCTNDNYNYETVLPLEDDERDCSKKKRKISIAENNRTQSFEPETPLETILSELLERLHVKDAVWCLGKEKKYYQVFFSIESGAVCEEAIQLLASCGIGTRLSSAVSVIPCALYYRADSARDPPKGTAKPLQRPGSAWARFVSSVRSRTTLAQLLQDVRADATLTFDWLFLLIVAAFVSAIGLVENSTVFLVASMLISPLMGPIMACAVGTAVRDASLQRMGLLHELFGLFLALVIGFLFGLAICALGVKYGEEVWPTYEMLTRCEVRSLWVGVLVALPSAAAVALAVLGGYTASLVGVAISASLLPPAVNAGLLWAMSLTMVFTEDHSRWNLDNTTFYSDDVATEIAAHGGVSLCLTIVNILCIYIGGVIVYKIKAVAPMNPKDMRSWRAKQAADVSVSTELPASARGSPASALVAWDYLSWCRSEGRRFPRMSNVDKHETWSPCGDTRHRTTSPQINIEAFWKQTSNIPACSKSIYGRLNQNSPEFLNTSGYTKLSADNSLGTVREDPGPSFCQDTQGRALATKGRGNEEETTEKKKKNVKKAKTTFTVTPAFINPLDDKF